jgi:uncharacterized protein
VQAAFAKKDEAIAQKDAALTAAKDAESAANGKIAVLETELADAKAAANPAAIEAAVAARVQLVADAKKIDPDMKTEGLSEEEIKKAALKKKLGDTVATMDAAAINGAFAAVLALAPTETKDTIANAIKDGKPVADELADTRRKAMAAKAMQYKEA